MLGEFEYLLIATAVRLGDEAYGAAIVQEIERTCDRKCSIGALYTTLDRLESKALIKTSIGQPTQARGGRARRMVKVTAKGRAAATGFYEAVRKVSRGTSWAAADADGTR